MKIDKLVIKCDFCHKEFKLYKPRKDGTPNGVHLKTKKGSFITACHDCICDEQHYRELLERVNGNGHNSKT